MPATTKKRRKKSAAKPSLEKSERPGAFDFCAAAAAGSLLGLSAPGFNLWYLAWVGIVPLLLLIAASKNPWQAFLRGLVFGFCYNLIYLNWYLCLYPLDWLGFNQWQGMLLSCAAWLVVSFHQALIIGIFASVCRLLPTRGAFLPHLTEGRLFLPSLITIPLAWVLLENKIGNAPDALGVPWSMIEYSQWQQLPIIQIASWIGGIGLAFLMVAVNVSVAGVLATISRRHEWQSLAFANANHAVRQSLIMALSLALVYAGGMSALAQWQSSPTTNVAIIQGNVNIDMQKTEQGLTLAELLSKYATFLNQCSPGLAVLAENALPTYLRENQAAGAALAKLAAGKQVNLIVGAMDRDSDQRPFNSAYGVRASGRLAEGVYHKRWLVPFGEYAPRMVEYMPEWLKRLTNTPSGGGFAAGKEPTVIAFAEGTVAPLICFEALSPELVASSVRNGGRLLVNISDLAWFHDSMVGKQMIAFSVFRAVECRRYFVFAANSGPSAVIAPSGKILSTAPAGTSGIYFNKAAFISEISPFVSWFQ